MSAVQDKAARRSFCMTEKCVVHFKISLHRASHKVLDDAKMNEIVKVVAKISAFYEKLLLFLRK